MNCHNCGEKLKKIVTDLPFKVRQDCIIIKQLPILQCQNCSDYLIEDYVMKRVDLTLDNVDKTAELEIVNYAA